MGVIICIPPDSLRFGHLGNGVTVYTTAHEENNDFMTLAHIRYNREVKFYKDVDETTRQKIINFAQTDNMTISATQVDQFALCPV